MSWAEDNGIDIYIEDIEYKFSVLDVLEDYSTDDELKQLILENGYYKSEYTMLVKNIIDYDKPLSKKQKWCLAKYYIDDYRR